MGDDTPERREDVVEIMDRKPGTRDVPGSDVIRAVGPESREVVTDWLTPIEQHYVLHRTNTPDLDGSSWTVSLTGAIDESVELAMEDLRSYPSVTVPHTMECAGNCRAYFEPEVDSVAWEFDGVSTALWTGVPLSAVLEDHNVRTDRELWLTAFGGDDPGADGDAFARSIPIAKALDDCILAYEMNGETLPKEHGYPVRLLVPGWYGVNSVKWLKELRIMESMLFGSEWDERRDDDVYYTRWQQDMYRVVPAGEEPEHQPTVSTFDTWDQFDADDVDHPYTFDVNVKSVIGYPADGASVRSRADGAVEVIGAAWAGDDDVSSVEVSANGGDTWQEAQFVHPGLPNAWRLFRFLWEPEPGTYTLVSRATDEHGRTQPARIGDPEEGLSAVEADAYPWNEGGYAGNASDVLSVSIDVLEPEDR